MDEQPYWRVRSLGWGNLLIGFGTPISVVLNYVEARRNFRPAEIAESIAIAILIGAVLSGSAIRSGAGILRSRSWAFRDTCAAGGFWVGYTLSGILHMATSGRARDLVILFRHGSEYWWDWSASYFQNSALREFPLLVWWIMGLGTAVRFPLAGAPAITSERWRRAMGLIFGFLMIGFLTRPFQAYFDLLPSER